MPRPHRLRRVTAQPPIRGFKPTGRPRRELETVNLGLDELEALRWADLEGLYQEEAAARMGISRPTFARVVSRGRAKVADALVHGKALVIGEGPVAPPGNGADADSCPVHGGPRRRGRRCRCRQGEGWEQHPPPPHETDERRTSCQEWTVPDQEMKDPAPEAATAVTADGATARHPSASAAGDGPEAADAATVGAAAEVAEGGRRTRGARTRARTATANESAEARRDEPMRIAISSQGPDLASPLDPRFGRARYFLVVDRSSDEVEVVDNSAIAQAPQGAGLAAVAALKRRDVDLLVTGRVGPKAQQALEAAAIRVVTGAEGTCGAVLEGLGKP